MERWLNPLFHVTLNSSKLNKRCLGELKRFLTPVKLLNDRKCTLHCSPWSSARYEISVRNDSVINVTLVRKSVAHHWVCSCLLTLIQNMPLTSQFKIYNNKTVTFSHILSTDLNIAPWVNHEAQRRKQATRRFLHMVCLLPLVSLTCSPVSRSVTILTHR